MSEQASDPNVEDVLSSVRRLVSQELPKRREITTKPAPDQGALVLTSKDRIAAEHSKRVAAQSLEQRIAELEKAVDQSSGEFEPDGSEDQAQHRPDRIVYTRPRPSEAEAQSRPTTLRLSEIALIDTPKVAEDEAEDDTIAPIAFRHGGGAGVDEAPMAEDVPTLPPAKAEVRAFSDPDDVVARIEARIERGGDAVEPVPEASPETKSATSVTDFDADLTAAVRASIAAQAEEEVEPAAEADTIAPEEAAGVTLAPAPDATPEPVQMLDVAQAAVLTARAKSLQENPVKAKPAADPDRSVARAEAALATLADEDAMRLLVGRLLREELQGDLGERITQTVRKLVRSEVKRLTETRSLD
ncbi:MAG: hypothetical protein ACU0GG_07390 [Paracoccaceae bacterium]